MLHVSEQLIKSINKQLLDKAYKKFIETGNLYINGSYEIEDNMTYHFEFYKDLNVVMYTLMVFEGYHFDDEISVNPELFKAETLDQAWKAIEQLVIEAIDRIVDYTINDRDFDDFTKSDDDIVKEIDWSFVLG